MTTSATEASSRPAGPTVPEHRRTVALDWLGTLARLGLGVVLLVAGAIKVADTVASVTAVRAYQLLPEGIERLVGYGLPFLEIGVGLLLVAGFATRLGAVVGGLLMLGFVVGIASAWARGLAIDCGCFGGGGVVGAADVDYVTPLLRDAGLVVVAGYLAWRPRSAIAVDRRGHDQLEPDETS